MATLKSKGKISEPIPKHRVLREVYRHYLEFRQYVSDTGHHVIEHGYFVHHNGTKTRVNISVSFWDLFEGLKELSPRKREAVWYNVILDQKQRDVAKKMSITTVSVGQYVEQAMIQLSDRYFAEEQSSEDSLLQGGGNTEGPSELPEATEQEPTNPTTQGNG